MKTQILQKQNPGDSYSQRIVTLEHATQYWFDRMGRTYKEPYLHCEFQNRFVAERAMDHLWKDLPGIGDPESSGQLTCGIYPAINGKS